MPDKSGLPSAVLGAGALRFGWPLGVLGIPGVGYFNHWAPKGTASGAHTAIATMKTTTTMRFIILSPELIPDVYFPTICDISFSFSMQM
jgi:hypothetical protein